LRIIANKKRTATIFSLFVTFLCTQFHRVPNSGPSGVNNAASQQVSETAKQRISKSRIRELASSQFGDEKNPTQKQKIKNDRKTKMRNCETVDASC
jgi:hypothetical protein